MSTPNINVHFILVGSNFHDSFVDRLKSKPQQYQYTTVSSLTEYKASNGVTRVIVVNGHDDELAKQNTLATLLDQPIILVFFAPSKAVLDALHKATNSLVSIPSVELEDGAPIIIHRRPHDGVISITPGFSILTGSLINYLRVSSGEDTSDSQFPPSFSTPAPMIPSPEEKLVMNYVMSVDVIQLTVKYLLESLYGDKVNAHVHDDLTPPPGTNFYKTTEISMVTYNAPGLPQNPSSISNITFAGRKTNQQYIYTSRLRVHAYCTRAKPDIRFSQNGGIVYVVAVLSGQFARDPDYDQRSFNNATGQQEMYWFSDSVSYQLSQPSGGSLTGVKGEPRVGSTNGLVTTYNIDFGANLNLWKSAGTQMFVFPAAYQESFSITEFKQKVQSQKQADYTAFIYYDNYYDRSVGQPGEADRKNVMENGRMKPFPDDNIPLNGLFTWTSPSLKSQTIDVTGHFTYAGFVPFSVLGVVTLYGLYANTESSASKSYTLDLSNWD